MIITCQMICLQVMYESWWEGEEDEKGVDFTKGSEGCLVLCTLRSYEPPGGKMAQCFL